MFEPTRQYILDNISVLPEPVGMLVAALAGSSVPWSFTVVIIILFAGAFFISLLSLFFSLSERHSGIVIFRSVPMLLTSLGILGTFFGVFIGLQDFDITNTADSFPRLLDGLKIAFSTSILGLATALLFRVLTGTMNSLARFNALPTEENVGLDTLHALMQEEVNTTQKMLRAISSDEEGSLLGQIKLLKSDMRDGFNQQKQAFEEFAKKMSDAGLDTLHALMQEEVNTTQKMLRAISSDEEGSLLGQIKLLKSDMRDGFNQQKQAFEEFAKKVAEANAKELFKALEDVIREFNEKLAEQVGESFKKLAQSVDRLVEWQENYKQQMEEMKRALDIALAGIEKGEQSLTKIAESLATIPDNVKTVSHVIETAQAQLADLDRHLQAFAEIRDKAAEVLPEIKRNVEDLSVGLKKTVEEQVATFDKIMEAQQSSAEQIQAGFEGLSASVNNTVQNVEETIKDNLSAVKEALKESLDDYHTEQTQQISQIQESFANTMTGFTNNVQNIEETIKDNLSAVKEALKESLDDYHTEQTRQINQIQESFTNTVTGITNDLENAVKQLDQALKDEIDRLMQELVDYLSGITERQVDDFQPLIRDLRDIVKERKAHYGE